MGLNRNWTKMGSPKVTDIEYNTVAPFIMREIKIIVVKLKNNCNKIIQKHQFLLLLYMFDLIRIIFSQWYILVKR